jgi:hypothetical protein
MNYKKNTLVIGGVTLLLLGAGFSTIALGDTLEQSPKQGAVTQAPLQITASISPSSVSPDKPIALTVCLKNNTNQTYWYSDTGGLLKEFKVDIRDSAGNEVPLTEYGKRGLPSFGGMMDKNRSGSIPPNGKIYYHIWLNRDYDMSVSGTYRLVVSQEISAEWLPSGQAVQHHGQHAFGVIESNPVSVTITVVSDQDVIKLLEND